LRWEELSSANQQKREGKMTKQFIERLSDLDLYMKVYPEAKRHLQLVSDYVKRIEAEIERREEARHD
jgi:hypothetical protein